MARRRAVPHPWRCALLATALVAAAFELRALFVPTSPTLDAVHGFVDADVAATGDWVVGSASNRRAGADGARAGPGQSRSAASAPGGRRAPRQAGREGVAAGSGLGGAADASAGFFSAALAAFVRPGGAAQGAGISAGPGGRRGAGAWARGDRAQLGRPSTGSDASDALAPSLPTDPQELLATTADLAGYPEGAGARCSFRPKARRVALLSLSPSAPRHAALWRAWLESSRGRFPAVALTGDSALCLERCQAVVPPLGQRATGDDADGCVDRCEADAVWNPICSSTLRGYVGVAGPAREELPRHLFTLYAPERGAGRAVASLEPGQGAAASAKRRGKRKKKKIARLDDAATGIRTANATVARPASSSRLVEDSAGAGPAVVGDAALAAVGATQTAEGAASIARILDVHDGPRDATGGPEAGAGPHDAVGGLGSSRRALGAATAGDPAAAALLGPPLSGHLALLRAMLMRASRDPANGYFVIVDDGVAPLYDAPTLWHALVSRTEVWRSEDEETDEPLAGEAERDEDEANLIVHLPDEDAGEVRTDNSTVTGRESVDERAGPLHGEVETAAPQRRALSRRALLQEGTGTPTGTEGGVANVAAPGAKLGSTATPSASAEDARPAEAAKDGSADPAKPAAGVVPTKQTEDTIINPDAAILQPVATGAERAAMTSQPATTGAEPAATDVHPTTTSPQPAAINAASPIRTMLPVHVISEPSEATAAAVDVSAAMASTAARGDALPDPPEMTAVELRAWKKQQRDELRASAERTARAKAAAEGARPAPPRVCVGDLAQAVRRIEAAQQRGLGALAKALQDILDSCAGAMLSDAAHQAFPPQSPWKLTSQALEAAREAGNAPPKRAAPAPSVCGDAMRDRDFSFLDLSSEQWPERGKAFPQASPVRILPPSCPLFAAGFVPGTEGPLLRHLARCEGGLDVVPCDPDAGKEDTVWW